MCMHTHQLTTEKHFVSQWTQRHRVEADEGEVVGTEGRTQDGRGIQSADRSLPVVVEAAHPLPSRATVCLCVSRSVDNALLKLMLSGLIKEDTNLHMGYTRRLFKQLM